MVISTCMSCMPSTHTNNKESKIYWPCITTKEAHPWVKTNFPSLHSQLLIIRE